MNSITVTRPIDGSKLDRARAASRAGLPEVGVHLACGVVWGRVGEYVDWFAELFDGGPRFADGQLVVPDEPGLGLILRETAAARWRV